MPTSYTIDRERDVVFSRAWGALADGELWAHSRALSADPRFDPSYHQIVDFREVEMLRVTGEGVREQAARNPFSRQSRRALVVSTDEEFGMARVYQSSLQEDPENVLVCRDLAEALAWVGLEPTTQWPQRPADWSFELDER